MRRVLVAAREHFDMDVSYRSHLASDRRSFVACTATPAPSGCRWAQASRSPTRTASGSSTGRLPNLLTDVRSDGRTAGLVPCFGSYVGVPVHFGDGRAYGMLCCASRAPATWLRDRDVATA
jgi:hypothetical protein